MVFNELFTYLQPYMVLIPEILRSQYGSESKLFNSTHFQWSKTKCICILCYVLNLKKNFFIETRKGIPVLSSYRPIFSMPRLFMNFSSFVLLCVSLIKPAYLASGAACTLLDYRALPITHLTGLFGFLTPHPELREWSD